MEQLSVPTMSQLYLGNQALQGLMEEEEEGLVRTAQPLLIDVELSGSPSKPSLSFSTTPYCSTLFLSPFPSPVGPLFTPSEVFSGAKRTHTQASSNMRPHTDTHAHKDRHRNRPRLKKRRRTHTHTHNQKSLKGFLILSALSSLCHLEPSLLSDYTVTPKKGRIYAYGDNWNKSNERLLHRTMYKM